MRQKIFIVSFHALFMLVCILCVPQGVRGSMDTGPDSSDTVPCLNFSKLFFHTDDPDEYTLYAVDTQGLETKTVPHFPYDPFLIPYLRPELFEKKDVVFSDEEPADKEVFTWIKIHQDKAQNFFSVRLMKRTTSHNKSFFDRIEGIVSKEDDSPMVMKGGMIFFPNKDKGMVYTFGLASKSLLNPLTIIPRWGLKVVASQDFCHPEYIREVGSKNYRKTIPKTLKERSSRFTPIQQFNICVGSEGIDYLRLKPTDGHGLPCSVKGDDYFHFRKTVYKSHNTGSSSEQSCDPKHGKKTIPSLKKIADYFDTLSQKPSFKIHPELTFCMDEEIKDLDLVHTLNEELKNDFQKSLENEKRLRTWLFLHDKIWQVLHCKNVIFSLPKRGPKRQRSFYNLMCQSKPSFEDDMLVESKDSKKSCRVPIKRFVYTVPVEYRRSRLKDTHQGYYRFERGSWFRVSPSRFASIKNYLRGFKKPASFLGLPDIKASDFEGGTKDYPELRYNKRAVAWLNQQPKCQAYMIDRLNVPLKKGGGHIFEFGDIFLIKDDEYYIIHVKRARANNLSHHREQLERTSDFLSTNLDRKDKNTLFLQGAQEALCEKYDLKRDQKTMTLEGLTKIDSKDDATTKIFKKCLSDLSVDQKKLFNLYEKKMTGALHFLLKALKEEKSLKKVQEKKDWIHHHLDLYHNALQSGEDLLGSGLISEESLKKTTLVLAIIDDRRYNKERKKFTKQTRPLIHAQDLWGLDRTRMVVQRHGLRFLMCIPNEHLKKTKGALESDAFGRCNSTDVDILEEASWGSSLSQSESSLPSRTHGSTQKSGKRKRDDSLASPDIRGFFKKKHVSEKDEAE